MFARIPGPRNLRLRSAEVEVREQKVEKCIQKITGQYTRHTQEVEKGEVWKNAPVDDAPEPTVLRGCELERLGVINAVKLRVTPALLDLDVLWENTLFALVGRHYGWQVNWGLPGETEEGGGGGRWWREEFAAFWESGRV